MYVAASGPGDPGGAGRSRRLRRGSPGLLFGSKRSLFKGPVDRSVVFPSQTRRRGFFRRLLGRPARAPRAPVAGPPTVYARSSAPPLLPDDEEALPTIDPPSAPAAPAELRPPVYRPEGPSAIRGIASGTCPKCHVPYLPAGTTGRWGCPFCGRHATTVGVAANTPPPSPTARPDRPGEQRHEELLAAWMIGGPLPCPRCRAALRHTTGGEFACPACGERTQLEELSSGPRAPSIR
jgi:uncharacterized Zn finger protein (UPF0148 family)